MDALLCIVLIVFALLYTGFLLILCRSSGNREKAYQKMIDSKRRG